MGTVAHLASEIEQGLRWTYPHRRKTVVSKLARTLAAVIQTQTTTTAAWAAVLPIATERADRRPQGMARLRADPLRDSAPLMAPCAGINSSKQPPRAR